MSTLLDQDYRGFEESVGKMINLITHPDFEWLGNLKHIEDHPVASINQTETPLATLIIKRTCSILYMIYTSIFAYPETILLSIAFSLRTMASNLGSKMLKSTVPVNEVSGLKMCADMLMRQKCGENKVLFSCQGVQFYKSHRSFWTLTSELFGLIFMCMYGACVCYFPRIQHWFRRFKSMFTFAWFAIQNVLLFGLTCQIHSKVRIINFDISKK